MTAKSVRSLPARGELSSVRTGKVSLGAPISMVIMLRSRRAGRLLTDFAVINSSATRDTIDYWITDSVVYNLDSLTVEARYLRTDSLDQLSWTKMCIRDR